MAIVEFKNVSRVYKNGEHEQRALDHVNLSLEEGKFIVVLGPSGAGKSTLLNLLGGLDSPTEGTIFVNGKELRNIGFVSDNPDEAAVLIGLILAHAEARTLVNIADGICGGDVVDGAV